MILYLKFLWTQDTLKLDMDYDDLVYDLMDKIEEMMGKKKKKKYFFFKAQINFSQKKSHKTHKESFLLGNN